MSADQAYRRSIRHRSVREQEADVFLRVNAVLRGAGGGDPIITAKALADNERLWATVLDTMRDPGNALPRALRAAVISLGLAVRREQEQPSPDLRFLIGINEQLAAGLSAI